MKENKLGERENSNNTINNTQKGGKTLLAVVAPKVDR